MGLASAEIGVVSPDLLGSDSFLEHLEAVTGRALRIRKAGRKPKK
jgi:hypothetical protein